jgi:hypothetical protein
MGNGLAGATVRLYREAMPDDWQVIREGTTNATGWLVWQIKPVMQTYRLIETDPGGYASVSATLPSGVPGTVVDPNHIEFELPEGDLGYFYFTDAEATPTPTATETATPTQTPSPTPTETLGPGDIAVYCDHCGRDQVDLEAPVVFTFTKPMITETVSFLFVPEVPYTVEWNAEGTVATLMPEEGLSPNETYSLAVFGGEGVEGGELVTLQCSFQMQGIQLYLPLVYKPPKPLDVSGFKMIMKARKD